MIPQISLTVMCPRDPQLLPCVNYNSSSHFTLLLAGEVMLYSGREWGRDMEFRFGGVPLQSSSVQIVILS